MDNCCVVAATWRYASAEDIARFTVPDARRRDELRNLKRRIGAQGLIYLATCNRAAFIFSAEPGATLASCRRELLRLVAGEAAGRRVFRSWEGEGAVEHIYLVAAGLDSAQPGEREIRGQLRDALDEATACATVDPELRRVVESALRSGKKVHQRTGVGEGRTSLAEIAAELLIERAGKAPATAATRRVALVGVTTMTKTCAARLHARGVPLLLVNRTRKRADELAERARHSVRSKHGVGTNDAAAIDTLSLDAFRANPPALSAVLFSTGAPGPVVDRPALQRLAAVASSRSDGPPLVVDMAIPADVSPVDADAAALKRLGMDQINELAQQTLRTRHQRTAEARALIDEELDAWREATATRSVAGALRAIGAKYQESLGDNLDSLLEGDLKGLSEAERTALRRWAALMAKRLSHLPVVGLRAVATRIGQEGVDAFLAAAAPELVEERRTGPAADGTESWRVSG